jgi:hypothetical protein
MALDFSLDLVEEWDIWTAAGVDHLEAEEAALLGEV